MTWFLSTFFWALLILGQFIAGLLLLAFSYVLMLLCPVVIVGFLIATARSAEAGWFSWLWGSDTRQLDRSLNVAQEAARVASQAAEAQAQQAEAQAQQNARLAETLGQLSSERSNLADHISALTELGLKDSQWAAALNASGPVLVCITVLLVAGLALWLVNRAGDGRQEELAATVELLVEEIRRTLRTRSGYLRGWLSGHLFGHMALAVARYGSGKASASRVTMLPLSGTALKARISPVTASRTASSTVPKTASPCRSDRPFTPPLPTHRRTRP